MKVTRVLYQDPVNGMTRVGLIKSEGVPYIDPIPETRPPEEIVRFCSAEIAKWTAEMIEKGMGPSRVAELTKQFIAETAEMVAERMGEIFPLDVVRSRAAQEEEITSPDPTDAGNPPRLSAQQRERQPGEQHAEDKGRSHLEPHNPSPWGAPDPIVQSKPSKSERTEKVFAASGYDSLGPDADGLIHMIHKGLKAEVLIHESGEWARRSGWDGSIVTGSDHEDVAALADD